MGSTSYCGVYQKFAPEYTLPEALKLLRLLRNRFAHTDGYYSDDGDSRKLYKSVASHFCLKTKEAASGEKFFPIQIDEVLCRLVKECEEEIKEIYQKYS